MANNFSFVGKIRRLKDKEFSEKQFPDTGWMTRSLNWCMVCGDDVHFVTIKAGKYADDSKNEVRTFSKSYGGDKGSSITIPWDDRLSAESVASVAYYRLFRVDLTGGDENSDRKNSFVHAWDYLSFVQRVLQAEFIKDRTFKVSGTIEINYSAERDEYYRELSVNSIELVADDAAPTNTASVDLFFPSKDMFDEQYTEKTGKATLKSYIKYYDRQAKKNLFAPFRVEFYPENEFDKIMIDFMKGFNGSGEVAKLTTQINIRNYTPIEELTESKFREAMTDEQRRMVAMGIVTFQELYENERSEASKIAGKDRVTENTIAKGKLKNGVEATEYKISDLKTKPTDATDAIPAKSAKKETNSVPQDTGIDELFNANAALGQARKNEAAIADAAANVDIDEVPFEI